MAEIALIQDIQKLAVSGFSDWRSLGDVCVIEDGDLLLFNYTAEAHFAARWNFFEQVSRGLIINKRTGEIVARPFDKFWNWLEGGRKASGHIVTVTEKKDGSLAILFRDNGKYRIATRGSFDGKQAMWATALLRDTYGDMDIPNEYTLLFELIAPENRIVVDYGNTRDLFLLAVRNRFTGEYLPFYPDTYELASKFGFPTPKVHAFNNITEIIERTGTLDVSEEGYVVEFSDGSRWKFKGDRYLELHRLISGLSFKHTLEAIARGTVDSVRSQIPDEFSAQFDGWVDEIAVMVAVVQDEVKRAFADAPKESRKDFAVWVNKNHRDIAPYLFAMLDGRDIVPMIYKMAFQDRKESSPSVDKELQ